MSQHLENVQSKFESWRSALADRLDHANDHLRAWAALEGFRENHIEELNIAPAFWGITMRAHLHAGLMNLAMLVDKNPRSVSLVRLLDYLREHMELFPDSAYGSRLRGKSNFDAAMLEEMVRDRKRVTAQKIANDIGLIDSYHQDIHNLEGWRNKALAHIDEELVRKGATVDQAYPLLRSRITEAVDAFGNIFNFYSLAYDSKEYLFGVPFAPGLQTIITALAQWRQLRRERTMRGS